MGRRTSQQLRELGRRVAQWRAQKKGRRIPDYLWGEAVQVAQVIGVWATAQELHFNYQALRDRVRQGDAGGRELTQGDRVQTVTTAGGSKTGGEAAQFVAVQMGQQSGAERATVIEVASRHGDRMRVEVPGSVDVVGVVGAFWSRQP